MFTPPPSPEPHRAQHISSAASRSPKSLHTLDVADDPFLSPHCNRPRNSSPERRLTDANDTPLSPKEDPQAYALLQKKRIARRTRLTVFLVPLVLVLIGLSTRYLARRATLDAIQPPSSWQDWAGSADQWRVHKRHPGASDVASVTTVDTRKPTGTALTLASTDSAVPTATNLGTLTVPSTPPVLPTPFPQAFDSTLSTDFETVGCQTFFTNMTQTSAFLKCRPFSLLVKDSNAFIQSQRNISLLNTIMWGTCNTDLDSDQCSANMAWFAENIKTQCKKDIAANNSIVTDAVAGLAAYDLMREVGCQTDALTNTYCYVEAAQAHPADLYLYALPLGLGLPNQTVPSCTSCVKNMMQKFVSDGLNLSALRETYPSAATVLNSACGGDFASTIAESDTSGASRAAALGGGWTVPALAASWAVVLGTLLTL
ncbi:hypothetical protein GY45DRAFT_1256727 [Cubamyces sp. BRFM 1775]|nr:hypothetical protein GY45DRAFT_1256727 [Cubamyces sp. BRFM 1775]